MDNHYSKTGLDRMEKMKQTVLKIIQRIVDEYGNLPVIELELALIEDESVV